VKGIIYVDVTKPISHIPLFTLMLKTNTEGFSLLEVMPKERYLKMKKMI
jgi:hypothetical protein